ncbi:histidine phosphatase family protein [Sphingomonas sp. LHG3406-1]|uniref:histidine phosphatase family protein n=1 Tax=Sphingomonas sp. LHG3406-1 TaxID=2804617 RepID=UPI00260568F7|nr:histidine phosphatase family protein [Sphingomonas sp. LHG3406-1]
MPIVHLLRHGAHDDLGLRLTGRAPDGGLSALGRTQAVAAARRLQADPPAAVYASPRRRTMETASIVAEHLGLEVMEAPALDEIDFGEWTGRSFLQLHDDPRWAVWNSRRSEARCPGGETMAEAQARALAFAFEVAATHDGPALLVTHCDVIRALHCWSERRSLDSILDTQCEPGSLSVLALAADRQAA